MIISNLHRDSRGGLYIGRMYSALFRKELDVVLHSDEEKYLQYAEKCAAYFNAMPEKLLSQLKQYSLRYCEDMREFFDPDNPEVPEDVNEETVLNYTRPNCLIIEKPADYHSVGFGVEFCCDWEKEHGMEWTLRGGRALYVGDFMGISPWYADSVYETQCRSYVYEDFTL